MHVVWTVMVTVLTLLAAAPAEAAAAPAIRVMAVNIRYGTAKDGENAWEHRRGRVVDVVRESRGDIIGLQEALAFQVSEIREAIPGFTAIGVGRDDGEQAGEQCTILFRADRFELGAHGTFWLSDTPDEIGSRTWGNTLPRICTWARFTERETGRSFYVFNTHFDHQSQPSRERAAELIAARIAAREHQADPVILMGDFNVGEANPVWRYLTGDAERASKEGTPASASPELRDTFRVLHADETNVGTFNGFSGKSDGEKIDAVFIADGRGEGAAGWDVLEAAIVRTSRDGRYPSARVNPEQTGSDQPLGRTVSTEQTASRSTRSAVEPSTRSRMLVLPRVPRTTRSASLFSTYSAMPWPWLVCSMSSKRGLAQTTCGSVGWQNSSRRVRSCSR